MSWRMAKALDGLRAEINAQAPGRSIKSDGGIGDATHSSHRSDHNPCGCCRVVCAFDFTHDPPRFDSYGFAHWLAARCAVGAEPRVKYIISNGRIASGMGQHHPAGLWRPYTGKNKHTRHVHVSVRHGAELFDNEEPWTWQDAPTRGTG
jgi:hypothetical protein